MLGNEILLISEDEVCEVLTMEETLDVVETVFREKALGRAQMPPKTYITIKKYGGDFRTMPSYLESLDIAGVKIVNVHPNNPRLYNKPTVMATIILIDPHSGSPLAIMGGTHVTAMRTGAAAGVATKYLARKESKSLGLVATGVQARTQLLAISKVLDLEEVRAYDAYPDALTKFVDEAEKEYSVKVTPCKSVEECVGGVDVVSASAPTTSPIVERSWIRDGMHINAIGADAPGKQELDPAILRDAKIVVDDLEQAMHSGEINVPLAKGIIKRENIYAELGEVVVGRKPSRENDKEITVFDSTGLSLLDVSTAARIYEKAKTKNMGKWVTL